MAKSDLLDEIRAAYLAAHTNLPQQSVDAFCAYVVAWLARVGVVGVGHTADGLALRLGDGREVLLFNHTPDATSADTPAVQLATSGVSARQGISGDAQAVRITGRQAH